MKLNILNNKTAALAVGVGLFCFTAITPASAQSTQRRSSTPAKENSRSTSNRSAASNQSMSKIDDQTFARKAMEANLAEVKMAKLALQKASSARVKEFAQMMIDEHSQANDRLRALVSGVAMGNAPEQMRTMDHEKHTIEQNTSHDATPDRNNVDNRTEKTGSESGLGVAASPAIGSRMGRTNTNEDHAPSMNSAYFNDSTALSAKHRATQERLEKLTGSAFDQEYIQVQIKAHGETADLYENQIKNGQDPQLKEYARNLLPAIRKHRQIAYDISTSMRTGGTSRGGR